MIFRIDIESKTNSVQDIKKGLKDQLQIWLMYKAIDDYDVVIVEDSQDDKTSNKDVQDDSDRRRK